MEANKLLQESRDGRDIWLFGWSFKEELLPFTGKERLEGLLVGGVASHFGNLTVFIRVIGYGVYIPSHKSHVLLHAIDEKKADGFLRPVAIRRNVQLWKLFLEVAVDLSDLIGCRHIK